MAFACQTGIRVAVAGAARNGVFRWTEAEKASLESWSPEVLGGVPLPPEQLNDGTHAAALYRAGESIAAEGHIGNHAAPTRGTTDADAR
jgi:hypothetical protein